MENNNSTNLRVGFHSIEMLLKLSPENIKKIFVPANRNDDRVLGLIAMAEKLSVSVERKKNLSQHPEAILKNEVNLGLSDLKKYEETIQHNNPTFLVIDKGTGEIGIYECSDEALERGKKKVEVACNNYRKYFYDKTENVNEYVRRGYI